MADVVLLEVSERIATITLNRPSARNALNAEVLQRLPERLREADERDDVDVVILTGADPAFCAGVDLKKFPATHASLDAGRTETTYRGPFPEISKPVIGAINGPAVTGGFELALYCDFLIASDRASFADTHARVGVMPAWGMTILLPAAIGIRRARELSFTGNYIDARDAFDWGLVNHVVEHEELIPRARELAADIASCNRDGVVRMRQTYAEIAAEAERTGWAIETAVSKAWFDERVDPGDVQRRRADVTRRGRAQAHGLGDGCAGAKPSPVDVS